MVPGNAMNEVDGPPAVLQREKWVGRYEDAKEGILLLSTNRNVMGSWLNLVVHSLFFVVCTC